MRCRHEINVVVFLCLAETDAVSLCVQHDIPACWSEQVPDSLLQALPKVSVLCWLHCDAGQERHQLVQEAHPSLFPASLGLIDRLCLSLSISELCYQTLLFTGVLKISWSIYSCARGFMSEIGKSPNRKRACSFFCLQLSLTKALFYPRFSKFHFFHWR